MRLLRGGGRGGVDGAVAQQLREELAHRLQQARVWRGQPPQQAGELRCARAERRLVGAEAEGGLGEAAEESKEQAEAEGGDNQRPLAPGGGGGGGERGGEGSVRAWLGLG